MSLLALRAENLAPFATSVRMMTAVETEIIGWRPSTFQYLLLRRPQLYSLEPSDYYFLKIHRLDVLNFGSFER